MDIFTRFSVHPKWLLFVAISCSTIGIYASDIRCGKPGRSSPVEYEPKWESYAVNSTVTYDCQYPRLVSKPNRRICQSDGTWSGTIPICSDRATAQQFLFSTQQEGRTAAKAHDGNPATCFKTTEWRKNEQWSAILPNPATVTAVEIHLPVGDTTTKVEVSVKDENSAKVVCNVYGFINGQSASKIFYCPENARGIYVTVQDRSYAEHYFELCEVTIFIRPANPCLMPDVPYNGHGNQKVMGSEKEYTYFCEEGYKLWGVNKSICKPNGTWEPKAPICQKIWCLAPKNPLNGSVSFVNNSGFVQYKGKAEYTCSPSFDLKGSSTRYCKDWNTWSGEEVLCFAKWCDPVSISVANGVIWVNSTTVKSMAYLVCNEGYKPLSDDRIECLPNGRWSHASLTCAPIVCDSNPVIPHGTPHLLDSSTYYGSRLQVICVRGYVIRNNELPVCNSNGTWGDLSDICIEITCDSLPPEMPERGSWHTLNDSFPPSEKSIRVLTCENGYHPEGSPVVIRCLENGSWSFTTATCVGIPEAVMWTSDSSPNAMMMLTAVAVGAGTAICILCLVATYLSIRKRRQAATNSTVFHVGMTGSNVFGMTQKRMPLSPEEHYYSPPVYEDFPEVQQNVSVPKPRKPCSGLPLLPLDTDPVYAQPFETGSSTFSGEHKFRKGGEDPYSGHIYAEPIDTRRPPSGSSTVSGCVAETWFRNGTVKMTRKMSLPDCQQFPNAGSTISAHKIVEAKRMPSTASVHLEGWGKQNVRDCTSHVGASLANSASDRSLGLFAELQSNSIYLRTGDMGDDLKLRPLSSGCTMTDNDIYLDDYFSNA